MKSYAIRIALKTKFTVTRYDNMSLCDSYNRINEFEFVVRNELNLVG